MKRIISKIKNDIRSEIRNMDGIQGRRRTCSISARIGKHFCPYCKNLLQIKERKQIVNSESEEAKDFDFTSMFEGGSLFGNIEFTWDVYYCENCNIELSIKDMISFERALKKTGENVSFDKIRETSEEENRIPGFLKICFVFTAILLMFIVLSRFNSCIGLN